MEKTLILFWFLLIIGCSSDDSGNASSAASPARTFPDPSGEDARCSHSEFWEPEYSDIDWASELTQSIERGEAGCVQQLLQKRTYALNEKAISHSFQMFDEPEEVIRKRKTYLELAVENIGRVEFSYSAEKTYYILKLLIDHGASPFVLDQSENTIIHRTIKENGTEDSAIGAVRYLLHRIASRVDENSEDKKPLIHYVNADGMTALHQIVDLKATTPLQEYINLKLDLNLLSSFEESAFYTSLQKSWKEGATLILEGGADVRKPSSKNFVDIVLLACRNDMEQIELQLVQKLSKDELNELSGTSTPLLCAVGMGHLEVTKNLLDKKAKTYVEGQQNPLLIEAIVRGSPNSADFLISSLSKEELHRVDRNSTAAAYYAASLGQKSVFKKLQSMGAPITYEGDDKGGPILQTQLAMQDLTIASKLLEAGADPKKTDGSGLNTLQRILKDCNTKVIEFYRAKGYSYKEVSFKQGYENAAFKKTAAHQAAQCNDTELYEKIISDGPSLLDGKNYTPFFYTERPAMLRYLLGQHPSFYDQSISPLLHVIRLLEDDPENAELESIGRDIINKTKDLSTIVETEYRREQKGYYDYRSIYLIDVLLEPLNAFELTSISGSWTSSQIMSQLHPDRFKAMVADLFKNDSFLDAIEEKLKSSYVYYGSFIPFWGALGTAWQWELLLSGPNWESLKKNMVLLSRNNSLIENLEKRIKKLEKFEKRLASEGDTELEKFVAERIKNINQIRNRIESLKN